MLEFMAGVVLTSKLCPKEMESTVYALLAGYQNFGQVPPSFPISLSPYLPLSHDIYISPPHPHLTPQTVSRSIGLYMMDAFSIKTVVPCDFSNLSYLLMVCHLWLPLVGVPLTLLLLPSQRLSEDIIAFALGSKKTDKDEDSASVGGGSASDSGGSEPLLKKGGGNYGSTEC